MESELKLDGRCMLGLDMRESIDMLSCNVLLKMLSGQTMYCVKKNLDINGNEFVVLNNGENVQNHNLRAEAMA